MYLFIFCCILAYFLGSIPTGYWIGQLKGVDITKVGSGNTGTTNTFRVLGKKAGSIVFIVDVLKGALPVFAYSHLSNEFPMFYIGLFAIFGHTFSIFLHFKGGKAVATTAGVLLVWMPVLFIIGAMIFAIILYFSRMVSFSSIVMSIVLSILVIFFNITLIEKSIIWILALFIIYKHRSNIDRIRQGNENKVPFGYRFKKESK